MAGTITDLERTRNHLADVLSKNLPSNEFVVAPADTGTAIVFADARGYFWLVEVSSARVADSYQGPG